LIGAQQGQRRRTFFFWRPVEGQHRPSTVRRPKHRFVKIPQVLMQQLQRLVHGLPLLGPTLGDLQG
jgi:hypothetical protein